MYQKEVERYKNKFKKCKGDITDKHITKGLNENGVNDLKNMLLEGNTESLKKLVFSIAKQLPYGVGKMTGVLYSSVIARLLEQSGISYTIHVGFILPVKVKDIGTYDYLVVNHMYLESKSGIKYHYFNGDLTDETFTYIKDDIVEV